MITINNYTPENIGEKTQKLTVEQSITDSKIDNCKDINYDVDNIEYIPEDFLIEFEEQPELFENCCFRRNKGDLEYYFTRICYSKAWKKMKEMEYMIQSWLYENNSQQLSLGDISEFEEDDCAEYFDDVHVLIIHDYPIEYAYKIGSTYEECKFIGCNFYISELYTIIGNYLDSEKQ